MAVLLLNPYQQFYDANGDPLSGGKIYTFEAGTTTPKATYTDSSGTIPLSNPVILDAAGRTTMWGDGTYKFTVNTSADVLVRTTDNVTTYSVPGAVTTVAALPQDFRLTLTTGVPVTTADVTGATTLYCTPYKGNRIALYTGTEWVVRASAQFSIALGTLTSDQGYDVFCYDNSGIPTLELTAWTSNTARATALIYQDGVLVKSGAVTRRYLGSFLTTSTTTTEDSIANRFLFNYYNNVSRLMQRVEPTPTWNYTTTTFRQANANTVNQLNFFVGVVENTVFAQLNQRVLNSNADVIIQSGIGLNSTTVPALTTFQSLTIPVAGGYVMATPSIECLPRLGKNALVWLEYSQAAGTTTWEGQGTFGIQGKVSA